MLATICFILFATACYIILIYWDACKGYKARIAEMAEEAHDSSNLRVVLEDKLAELNEFIRAAECDMVNPNDGREVPSPIPVNTDTLIERIKQRHTARIAAYDFEQRKQDEANRKLGTMYRELQCTSGQAINTLRAQLTVKLRVKCPVCAHVYQNPEPKPRVKRAKVLAKGVIQSVPVKAVSKLKPANKRTADGQVNRSYPKRNPNPVVRNPRGA